MMFFIALSLLVASVAAQQEAYRCECALLNSLQIETSSNIIPLEYYGLFNIAENQCSRPVGTVNDCMIQCQERYSEAGGLSLDLCTATAGSSPRCTGSKWCESLHNSGITNVALGDGVNSLYYRMIDCEGTEYVNWQYAFREITDDGLCCSNGRFSHCTTPCEDACESNNLCECGIFIASQFNEERLNGTNPLPVQNVGTEFGPGGEFVCNNWPGPDFGHPCDTSCLFASRLYKSNVNLQDPSPNNPSISVGDSYCKSLKARWAEDWPANGVGPEDLVAHARMPGCDKNDGTLDHLKWNTARRYSCHHQALCCDGEGFRVRCEGAGL